VLGGAVVPAAMADEGGVSLWLTGQFGSLAAVLQGIDGLVFTAGIGEHSTVIRARICQASSWLGVELDPAANGQNEPRISTPRSRVSVWVIPTNEELMIARHTRSLLGLETGVSGHGFPSP